MDNGVRKHVPNDPAASNSDPVLNYISQILLEEEEEKESIDGFFDATALRAAEYSFYEALHGNITSLPFYSNAGRGSGHGVDAIVNPGELESSCVTNESLPDLAIQLSSASPNSGLRGFSSYSFDSAIMSSLRATSRIRNVFGGNDDTESILELQRVMEEAAAGRGKKHHYCPQENELEERSSKQSAVYEEVNLSRVFDKVLLCCDEEEDGPSRVGQKGGRRHYSRKRGDNCEIVVDVVSLLTSCAQPINDGDYRGAQAELKKIRQNSSPTGNADQRLAHIYADALEARLTGTHTRVYQPISPKSLIVSELAKSDMTEWPIMRMSVFFSNTMIYEAASRCSSLHIIDFGILHGIQWPTLIRDLSKRRGGPPRLRITGIELPQPGFRPSQMLAETGLRLENFCKCFGVPFKFNALTAQHWEAIKIDDLKLVSGGEMIAVNCNIRFEHLLDETVVAGYNPKDEVLNLIREVNPDIYVQTVESGGYNSPFFLPRFQESLLFFSGIFDACEAFLPHNHPQRLSLEQEFLGRDIMNVIACEGIERIKRPETYKQWQSRILRAGFKPFPLKPRLFKKLIAKARASYHHNDFIFIEDGIWILQGWKGRVFIGSSCWVAA
ncbi:unnamed protein product [Cuscuta epithymum]|uniref:Uncharacterized protein n=1 Tax=Cuscuta epithymum TaxID=186058 RepID=A0AAV0GKH5_9ASTE|nr:unnamed protein product [Cuscuta epithymum]